MTSHVGRYDSSVEERIYHILEQCSNWGISISKVEASAIMVEKEKRAKITEAEVRSIIARLRGLK